MYGHSVKEISDKIRAEGKKITESVLFKSRAVSTALTNVSQYLFDTIPFKTRKTITVTANYDKKNDAVAYATSESNIYVNFGNSYLDKNPIGKKNTTQSSSRMDIYQVSTVNEWWGLTTMYNGSTEVDPFSSNWAWGKIQLDADFSDLSENKRLAVIAHEMGHVMGLAHSDFSNVLMRTDIAYNSSSTSRAQTNDLGGINYLYK